MARVLIVIVNFRTADLTIDCLRSIAAERTNDIAVDVVENCSGDDSADRLGRAVREEGWDWCRIIPLSENRGYAAGNNSAIAPALTRADPPEYLLLLNPDTIVRPGGIREIVTFMDVHPSVGIAGSRLEHPDGTPQISAFRFPSVIGEFEESVRFGLISKLLRRFRVPYPVRDSAHRTDWVAGASMIVRRSVFDRIGLMDDRYFLYFEETDFCRRARRRGVECWYVPTSRVVHLVGQSTGVTDRSVRKRRPTYWFDSRSRYYRRNLGRLFALAADSAFVVGRILRRCHMGLRRKVDDDPPRFLRDFLGHAVRGWMR